MPSIIALGLFVIFVAALLRVDYWRSEGLSKALWIPTLWFLYCASRPLDLWFNFGTEYRHIDEAAIEAGNPLDRSVLSLLILLGIIILIVRRINWVQVVKENRWLFIIFVYMLISIVWSDHQFVSFKRWVRTAGTVIMALVVMSEMSPYLSMQAVLRRTIYVTIPLSVLLVKYFPSLGVRFGPWNGEPMYAGVTLDKNTLGEVCMICVLFLGWCLLRRREDKDNGAVRHQTILELIILAMAFYLMKGPSGYGASSLSYSATSIAVLVSGIAAFFAIRRLKSHQIANLGKIVCVVLVTAAFAILLLNVLDTSPEALAASLLGRNSTLTGRTDLIWNVLLPIAWQNPMLGVGFGAFWLAPVPGLTLDVHEAHNGYLEVFIGLGIVGLVLLLFTILEYFRKAKNELKENLDWAAFRLAFLVIVLLHNWTESTFLLSREVLWNVFVLFLVAYPKDAALEPVIVDVDPIEDESFIRPQM